MKTICISQQDDGTFSVYEEAAEPMGGEAPMPESEEGAKGQPATSIDEALELARTMFDAQPAPGADEAAALAGYNKGQRPMGKGMPTSKVFGE